MAPSAVEAQVRVLVVRVSPEGGAAPDALAEQLREGLAVRGVAVEIVAPAATRPVEDPRSALADAQTAYYELRAGDAAQMLEAWVERAEASGGAGLDRDRWLEGLAWLARARLAVDDEAGADAALDRLCAVHPTVELDPATYAPAFRERLAGRCRARSPGVAMLRIEVQPPAARIRIDGAEAPAARVELPVGPHLIRAEAPGHRASGMQVHLTGDAMAVQLALAPDPEGALAAPGPPGGSLEPLRAAAEATGRMLTVVDAQRGAAGWRLALRDEASRRSARAGPEPDLVRAVRGLLASWDVATAASPIPQAEDETDPWPWVAVGVAGAVAAAVAIGLAVAFGVGSDGLSAVGMREP